MGHGTQIQDGEYLAMELEAKIFAPLEILPGIREREAILANGIDVHLTYFTSQNFIAGVEPRVSSANEPALRVTGHR